MRIAEESAYTGSGAVLLEDVPAGGSAAARRCLGSRTPMPREAMIRFVLGPDSMLVPDLAGRLPGRGMWISADRASVDQAVKRGQFAKAARARVEVPPDLAGRLEQMLARRVVDLVGLARRAGELVAGFDQCADWLRHGKAALVLCATDGSADGRRRMAALAGKVPVLEPLTRAELGSAIGRDEVVHVAVAAGGVQSQLLKEIARLRGFRNFSMSAAPAAVSNVEEDASHT